MDRQTRLATAAAIVQHGVPSLAQIEAQIAAGVELIATAGTVNGSRDSVTVFPLREVAVIGGEIKGRSGASAKFAKLRGVADSKYVGDHGDR